MKKSIIVIRGAIQLFVSLGAVICGIMLIVNPGGVMMKMSVNMLSGKPFTVFLAPGIILLLICSLGQLPSGILTRRKSRAQGLFGDCLGVALVIWIVVQVKMIGGRNLLRYAYFGIGS